MVKSITPLNVSFSSDNAVRLGGGTIGCSRDVLYVWHQKYYENFRFLVHAAKFVGKDQNIMATTCLETDLCLLVSTNDYDWFMLQEWLIGNFHFPLKIRGLKRSARSFSWEIMKF